MPKNPRANDWTLDWTHPVTGMTVAIGITHTRNYLVKGQDHIEARSVNPAKAPLPITDTGYLSHFVPSPDVINRGGPIQIVKALLAAAEQSKEWRKKDAAQRQQDLFAWAAKQTVKRGPAKASKRPATKATRVTGRRPSDPK